MSEIQANKLSPSSGTSVQLGDSGDTFTIPSGATFTNNGTATGFGNAGTNSFRAIGSANQTGVSSNTFTKVAFNTDAFDPDGVFDTSNQRFVAPADGKYFLTASVNIVGATDNSNIAKSRFYKNGSALSYTENRIQVTGASNDLAEINQNVTVVLDLSTNDYIEFYALFNVATGTVTFQTQTDAIFAGFRVA